MKPNVTVRFPYVFQIRSLISQLSLILILTLGFVTVSEATDYYFSSSTGNDSYSSSQAQNPATPWRSLGKFNSISNTLKSGDRVLFKNGDVFLGNLSISRGGSSGNPIIFTSYGSGAKPIITSMESVSSWRSVGNGIYEAGITFAANEEIQIVSVNGQLQEIGRFPNYDEHDEGFLTIVGVNGSSSIQGASLPANFAGGEIVIRKNNWIIDRHEISNSSGSTVNFLPNPSSSYPPQKGYGYFVQNHVSALDSFGEWAFTKSTRKLYVYFGSQNPASLDVRVARGIHLVDVSKYIGNVSFSNLNFVGSNRNLINLENSNNIKVVNCDFRFAGHNSIYAHTTPDIAVSKNSFDYSLSGGMFFQFGTPRAIIQDNTVDHTMPFQGMAQSSDLRGVGIYIAADANNSVIERNRVLNTGFNGIHFGGNYTLVKNNFIDNFCLLKQDGGGIYTNSDGFTTINNVGREVEGNIITRGVGALGGSLIDYRLVEGIYMDDNTSGVKISGNTISDISGRGMYFHNSSNIEVYDNLFHNIPVQFLASHDYYGNPIRNLQIARNQFSSIYKDEIAFAITSIDNDVNQIGQSNNNYFLDPYGKEVMFRTQSQSNGGRIMNSSLGNWQNQLGYEQNSIAPDFELQPYVVKSSTTVKSSDFSSGLSLISGVYNVTSERVNGISAGTWKVSSSSAGNGSAFIQIGNIVKGEEILVEFETRSSTANQTVEVLLENTFQLNQEGSIYNFVTSNEVKKVKILLKSEVNVANESVVFRFPTAIQGLLVDNIKISKVQTTPVDVKDHIFFRYNYSNKAVSFPLSGSYKNAKGEEFTGSVSVPAYRSVLLARVDKGEEQVISPPSVQLIDPVQNQGFEVGEDILIKANASVSSGQVQRVEFYAEDKLIGTATNQPYQASLKNVQAGNYTLMAKVIDSQNVSAESENVEIQVRQPEDLGKPAPNQSPTVSILSPVADQTFLVGEEVIIKTKAADPEGKIGKVEFYANNMLLGSATASPYQLSIKNAPAGSYSVKAKIYDAEGLTAESSAVSVSVMQHATNLVPAIQITAPTQNQSFSKGQDVVIKTSATDPENKIWKVEFYSGTNLIGVSTSSPYEYTVSNVPLGSYAIKAKVFDQQGLSSESSTVNVKVIGLSESQSVVKNNAPMIEITSPSQGQTLIAGQEVVIKTSVWDLEDKIAGVEFYVGGTLLGSVTSAPYEFSVPKAPSGSYTLKAKIYDQGGLTAESSEIDVTVNNLRTNSLKLVEPFPGQQFTASDIIPVIIDEDISYDSIQVMTNGQLIGSTIDHDFEFSSSKLVGGEHLISVKAFSAGIGYDSTSVLVNLMDKPGRNLTKNVFGEQQYTYEIGPNPNSGSLTVFMDKMYQPEEVQIQIYGMNGVKLEEIETNTGIGSITFDVSNYSSGVYLIKIAGKVFPYDTKRFIKK